MTIFGEFPLTLYIWKSPPPGSLSVQSTNFVSHLLSHNKALILRPALGSMLKNIRALALSTDLTPFRLNVRAVVRIFSELTEESVNKHLLVFLAPNIIFIGQMEKDIGRGVSRVQYLSTADQ